MCFLQAWLPSPYLCQHVEFLRTLSKPLPGVYYFCIPFPTPTTATLLPKHFMVNILSWVFIILNYSWLGYCPLCLCCVTVSGGRWVYVRIYFLWSQEVAEQRWERQDWCFMRASTQKWEAEPSQVNLAFLLGLDFGQILLELQEVRPSFQHSHRERPRRWLELQFGIAKGLTGGQ